MLARLEVLGPLQDVHSGAVSGPAPNPILESSRLLGRLHDDRGRITVPGFYDSVVGPSQRFRDELAALPYTDEDWLQRSRTRSVGGEAGYTVLERLWARPAIEATSMIGGDPIGPSRAAVPSVATADLSTRYVRDQTGAGIAEQLRHWVADTISDQFEYRLTVSADSAQDPGLDRRTDRRRRHPGRLLGPTRISVTAIRRRGGGRVRHLARPMIRRGPKGPCPTSRRALAWA
jgi:acetylornithine deacetylase/succinyl-diaminopimelate desuccinylase-like protein